MTDRTPADRQDPPAEPGLPRAEDLPLAARVALLSGSGPWHTEPLPAHGVPPAMLGDGPHGIRKEIPRESGRGMGGSEPATCFPPAVTLASTWDEALVEEVGRAVGVEARALGVDVVLGPGMNIKRHPRCGRNFEYLSEDPLLSGRLAAALVRGVQSQGVGACVKHFAVNNQESHRFVVDAVVDERTLRELYLSGFELAVRTASPWTVMASYNRVNGTAATHHHQLLTEILREEWGFEGLVMSDWGAVSDRPAGVAAGMDLEMPGGHGLHDAAVLAAVREDGLPARAVTASAQRVLDLVARSPRSPGGELPVWEHDALARRTAAAGTVLLTNDGTLPLRPDQRVALIGGFAAEPRFQGNGSSLVEPLRVTDALGAMRDRGVQVTCSPGYAVEDVEPEAGLIEDAVAAAREADVAVVMVGLPTSIESEAFDRSDLALPPAHNRLVEAVAAVNPRTVVALSNGGPVLLPWVDDVAAVVESYLGGQASGGALVDVLLGDVEPGGRLAESFPHAQADVASDPYFPGSARQVEHREGLFVGYRHHVTAGVEPRFAFGHGLGYTSFSWSGVEVDRTSLVAGSDLTVRLEVTNTGDRAGSEVVQVYLHDRSGVVLRPRRELAGYAKAHLQPGETRRVEITVPARAFAFWDVEQHGWRTPSGRFAVEVARSSVDVVDVAEVEVTGGVASSPEPPTTPAVAATDEQFARRLGRAVPQPRPARPFTRDSTFEELADHPVGAAAGALLWRASGIEQSTADPATRAFLRRGFQELPLRAAAALSGGGLGWSTVDLLLDAVNNHPVAVARRLGRAAPGLGAGLVRGAAHRLARLRRDAT